jgi:hypothetical protein
MVIMDVLALVLVPNISIIDVNVKSIGNRRAIIRGVLIADDDRWKD